MFFPIICAECSIANSPRHFVCFRSIESLESDMAAIQSEHETQDRVMQAQKAALHTVVADIASLRLIGKDPEAMETEETISEVLPEEKEDGEEDGEGTSTPLAAPSPVLGALNPTARPFIPGPSAAPPSRTSTPVGPQSHAQRRLGLGTGSSTAPSTTPSARPSPRPPSPKKASTDDDVEMGEVAEQKVQKRKGRDPDEELEEGEATDSELSSSELSEPPED
jgi:THO complex subunit 7